MSALPRARVERGGPARSAPGWVWASYAALGVLLTAYLASLVFRSAEQRSLVVDGWMVATFELAASALCLVRAFTQQRGRTIPLIFGLGMLSWTIGDFTQTAESVGASAATPSLADAFFLGFYPLTYVALVLTIRRGVSRLIPASWLDGAVAGLGAAAVCASFPFNAILNSEGASPVALATNLAYPVGDLLLLALVVGGTAIYAGRLKAPWLLLAGACAMNAVGDTFNLFHAYESGPSQISAVFDGIAWPTALLLISISVWMRPGQRDLLAVHRAPGFLLPGVGAIAGLVILFMGTVRHVGLLALGLAAATLVTVGVRLVLSARSLRSLTEERRRQSLTDELTGLSNRRHLFHMLDAFFADHAEQRTPERQLGFLFVDLDHFKQINDSFGHAAGDEVLKQLGPRLAGSLRNSDVLVRVGGDEFGVVLTETDPVHATSLAQRLTAKLVEPFVIGGVNVRISASIGIAFAPSDAGDTAELMRCADHAMYRAKLSPDTTFEIYRRDLDDGGGRLRLVEELRGAVEEGQFVLHYQPQVDLRTGQVSAVEALIRWPHPRMGLVPPLEFIPLAEEFGLMQPLTVWVLEQALTQCAAWRAGGSRFAVSVNVSASNLMDDSFVDLVGGLLARHQLPPAALILEITETTIIEDFERCKLVIAQLQKRGLDVSIDDFGAGFTSLAYLGSLAVHELKLDRTFVAGLGATGEGRDLELVRATIHLGHALGLRVVAEGIEDRATLDVLTRVGCDLAQGYFISRPVPAGDLILKPDKVVTRPLAGLRAS
jgi:diguanylate cyclase (GGDEF)-like protein